MLRRASVLLFGILGYTAFFVWVLYAIAFLGNFGLSTTMDSVSTGNLGTALLINLSLVVVFALQHSVMARPAFKRWWTQYVPKVVERSMYVLVSSLAMMALFWCWQPMGGMVWNVESMAGKAVLYTLYGIGWAVLFGSSFMINHFDLFGLRQTWLYFRGREYTALPFAIPSMYRHVRHPLYVGWITLMWATPTMSVAHLVFAMGMTGYILVAIRYEERDLVTFHGQQYAEYRRRTPMLIPKLSPSHPPAGDTEPTLA